MEEEVKYVHQVIDKARAEIETQIGNWMREAVDLTKLNAQGIKDLGVKVDDLSKEQAVMYGHIETLLETHKKAEREKNSGSNRNKDLFYSLLEKLAWITIGIILLNGKKIVDTFF